MDTPAILGGSPIRPEGPPGWPLRELAVLEALERAYSDGSWGRYHGPHTERLAAFLSEYHGVPHVHLCASGTAAVELALRGLGVGPGDEVILAAYEFKANFQNILTIGAVPVLVDVRADNWNLDVARLEAALSPKTKAILVSHLHGGVVDLPWVLELARPRGLRVLEDACQMPGARIGERIAGTWGDAGVLSFGGSKLTTAGRGGAVLTSQADVLQRIRVFTQRGNDSSPLSELQAAVLLPQWQVLEERNAIRSRAVEFLCEHLQDLPGLVPFRNPPGFSPGYYKLGLQYDPSAFQGLHRDAFADAVRAEGIAIDAGFRALHSTHAARRYRSAGELIEAGRADRNVLVLHHPVLLGTESDWMQIIDAVRRLTNAADDVVAKFSCH